jgi:TetR/AcrR family transcriptional regulator, tetracycline repressor protein
MTHRVPPHLIQKAPSERTRVQPLTRERVLAAALAIVDREGLAKLSMRRLGADLGVDPMAVYHYLPNKAALLDGLIDAVMIELGVAPARESGQRLSDWVVETYKHFWDQLVAHPNVLPIMDSRMITGEAAMLSAEQVLIEMERAGIASGAAVQALTLITTVTIAVARTRAAREETARDPMQVVVRRAAIEDLDPERFGRVRAGFIEAPVKDWWASLEFTLRSLVASLERGDAPHMSMPAATPESMNDRH